MKAILIGLLIGCSAVSACATDDCSTLRLPNIEDTNQLVGFPALRLCFDRACSIGTLQARDAGVTRYDLQGPVVADVAFIDEDVFDDVPPYFAVDLQIPPPKRNTGGTVTMDFFFPGHESEITSASYMTTIEFHDTQACGAADATFEGPSKLDL